MLHLHVALFSVWILLPAQTASCVKTRPKALRGGAVVELGHATDPVPVADRGLSDRCVLGGARTAAADLLAARTVVRQYSDHEQITPPHSRIERSVGPATTLTTRFFLELRLRTANSRARAARLISHCRRSRTHSRRARKKAGAKCREAGCNGRSHGGWRPLLLRAPARS